MCRNIFKMFWSAILLVLVAFNSCKDNPADSQSTDNSQPVAEFLWEPSLEVAGQINYDACLSIDEEDSIDLEYRWDFDANGTWDTDWSHDKKALHSFGEFTKVTTKMQARDKGGLSHTISHEITYNMGTMVDIDGNIYKTIKIGNQLWMRQNLKVTHYRTGATIPYVTNDNQWNNLDNDAYCCYNHDQNIVKTYGYLYNWNVVNDERGLAPEGWHVPTDDDWKELELFLGMSQDEVDRYGRSTDGNTGGKMKMTGTGYWNAPNTGATNESGFTALAGGCRSSYGSSVFNNLGINCYFWTSTPYIVYEPNAACYRHLNNKYAYIRRSYSSASFGYSVRCIKD